MLIQLFSDTRLMICTVGKFNKQIQKVLVPMTFQYFHLITSQFYFIMRECL